MFIKHFDKPLIYQFNNVSWYKINKKKHYFHSKSNFKKIDTYSLKLNKFISFKNCLNITI